MTKELLEKLKNAKTNEDVKQIVEDNKAELTDADLDDVSGGKGRNGDPFLQDICTNDP